ncbi:MAG TPA: metallophosphoesterase, partial [Chitinophagaceae bacterium]
MRRVLRFFLLRPVLWMAGRISSRPIPSRVSAALSALYAAILEQPCKKGPLISFDAKRQKLIVFSDQHKGAKNGADDFMVCENNYIAALQYYNERGFLFISLGDNEELWENRWPPVKRSNTASYEVETKFVARDAFIKVFGNHDLAWNTDPTTVFEMQKLYGQKVPVYEGVILNTTCGDDQTVIFLTHGHQGDAQSDGNWFSKFFVAHVWAPLQSLLNINPNTPAYNTTIKTLHNRIMYEWSAGRENLILVTGHTHQPVFNSLTHLERLYRRLEKAQATGDKARMEALNVEIKTREPQFTAVSSDYLTMRPGYFNSGCCCF